jgi:hypothetical protein
MNDWEKKHGARRRELDRKLLVECERALNDTPEPQDARLASKAAQMSKPTNPPPPLDQLARDRIALAFGRPLN